MHTNTQTPYDEKPEFLLYKQLCLSLNDEIKIPISRVALPRDSSLRIRGRAADGDWYLRGTSKAVLSQRPPPPFCFRGCDFSPLVTGRKRDIGPFIKEQEWKFVVIH